MFFEPLVGRVLIRVLNRNEQDRNLALIVLKTFQCVASSSVKMGVITILISGLQGLDEIIHIKCLGQCLASGKAPPKYELLLTPWRDC